ncbi:TRAP transporter small permease [Sporosarcina jiandibaonis]|uniref:TRAP transporter small permease n=1 Tax=Sporosarcina jiandibaonis TaxID=2715535 RepID=UPI001557008E|nr:TRAP transporter small permease [Sporosarcina jiandibaonis]
MPKLTENIVKILSILCVIAITGLTVIVFVQVFSRFIKFSMPGTEELARLLIVWLTFLGSSLAIHEKMHLGVRYFVSLVSENKQKKIDFFIHLIMMGFFFVLMIYGFKLTWSTMATTSATLQLPMGVFYGVIPVSAVFSIYFILMNMLNPTSSSPSSREATL